MEIKVGMQVFGVFRNSAGHFSAKGTVTEVKEDSFVASYKIIAPQKYKFESIGKSIFLSWEDADRSAQELEDEKWQKDREDFAEQNSLLGNL